MSVLNLRESGRGLALVLGIALLAGCATFGGGGASNPFVGTWNMTVNSPMGDSEQVLTVNKDLTGTVNAPDLGDPLEILNATVEGQSVSFDIVFDMQGQQLEAEFKGTIDGDSISGEYITDFGNATVTGTRN